MYEELLTTAVDGARAGAKVLLSYFRGDGNEVRSKGGHDLVSKADHESEAQILGLIRQRFPDHQILAEESGESSGDSEFDWVVDPLDGTANFLRGLPVFSISVACRRAGSLVAAAVLDPLGDNLFTATRGGGAFWNGKPMRVSERQGLAHAFLATGYPFKARTALDRYLSIFRDIYLEASSIRRCGSAALDLAYTAAGVYDGFFELRISPWDFAAGALFIPEAGGVVTDLDGGDTFFEGGNLLAGPPTVHADILKIVQRHLTEAELDRIDPVRERVSVPAFS